MSVMDKKRQAKGSTPGDKLESADIEVHASPWPVLDSERALYGLVGDVVRVIEPQTEADPVAILVQMLVGFGNLVGRKAYFQVESSRHYPNLFAVLVGRTSRARKGTSWQRVLRGVLERGGDEAWAKDRIVSGLSSGEGVIWNVRDPIFKNEPVRERGEIVRYEQVQTDAGVTDKRLLVVEEEFANVLCMGKREGNILGGVLRNAWDTGTLQSLTKTSPAKSHGAHISIIGHITKRELLKQMGVTDAQNGFLNRFLWLCVTRSKLLPNGGEDIDLSSLAGRLSEAFTFASMMERRVYMTGEANDLWVETYETLTADRLGLMGFVTSRSEAQTLRIALVFALMECSTVIDVPHLQAALAIEDYVTQSAKHVFGTGSGDPLAEEIRALLLENPDGVSQRDICHHFQKNRSQSEIAAGLSSLVEAGLVTSERRETGKPGRPPTVWKTCEIIRLKVKSGDTNDLGEEVIDE